MQPSDQNEPMPIPPNIQDTSQIPQPQQFVQPPTPTQEQTIVPPAIQPSGDINDVQPQTIQQSSVASGVLGSAPQPIGTAVNFQQPAIRPKSKINNKLILIIIGSIAGLAALVVGGWLLMNFVNALSLPLKEYSNDNYSILVPESYKQTGDNDSVSFEKPNTEDGEESLIQISYIDVSSTDYKDEIVSSLEESLTEEGISDSISFNKTIKNYKLEKNTKGKIDYRIVTADVMDDDQLLGKLRVAVVISEDSIVFMMIGAHKTESGLMANMSKITDSLKLK
jgi:hypothetical protein